MAPSASPPAVGDRVMLGGKHRATIRYLGPVGGQEGQWVGVEYDEPNRGRHDGSHAGRRYFSCSHPTAGSLVRLPKFLEAADFGRSLAAAAAERYGQPAASGGSLGGGGVAAQQQQQTMYLSTAGNRRVAVELVTSEHTSAARGQSSIGGAPAALIAHAVSSVGSPSELQAMLPSLTELDLSDNLIANLTFVAELAAALPTLHTLNLSSNRLMLPGLRAGGSLLGTAVQQGSLACLQSLVLNGCGVSWEQAVAVGQQLPALRELRLCGNSLVSLTLPQLPVERTAAEAADAEIEGSSGDVAGDGSSCSGGGGSMALLAAAFSQLELLDLEDNQLSSWDELAPLCALPALRILALSGNRLTSVQYSGGFAALRVLLLGGNRLGSWAAVDQLDRFPSLEEARLSDNPVTAAAPSTARYQCIARISQLTTLNASIVSPAERWDAEVNYLRQVTDEVAAAGAEVAAAGAELAGAGAELAAHELVLAQNPRFAALTQKYGELAPTAPKAAAGTSLASSMAQLTIRSGSKEVTKKLPVSLSVGKLKLMLERLLRVKATRQALLLVPPPDSGSQPEDITDDESRELRYYDACDGCRLEVSTSDPAARAAALASAKASAAAAHAQRMEQHENTIQQFRAVEQRLMT